MKLLLTLPIIAILQSCGSNPSPTNIRAFIPPVTKPISAAEVRVRTNQIVRDTLNTSTAISDVKDAVKVVEEKVKETVSPEVADSLNQSFEDLNNQIDTAESKANAAEVTAGELQEEVNTLSEEVVKKNQEADNLHRIAETSADQQEIAEKETKAWQEKAAKNQYWADSWWKWCIGASLLTALIGVGLVLYWKFNPNRMVASFAGSALSNLR